jgi:hypothetical protein
MSALFIGLSLGTKLLPGLLFVPLLVSRSPGRARRVQVIAAVVTVAYLPFVVWDAGGLWANFVRFNFVRASDSTSIVDYLPTVVSKAMLVVVLGALVWLYRQIGRRGWTTRRRLDFVLAAHLGVLATGPILHNNYLVWLLPVAALHLTHEVSGWREPTQLVGAHATRERVAVGNAHD